MPQAQSNVQQSQVSNPAPNFYLSKFLIHVCLDSYFPAFGRLNKQRIEFGSSSRQHGGLVINRTAEPAG